MVSGEAGIVEDIPLEVAAASLETQTQREHDIVAVLPHLLEHPKAYQVSSAVYEYHLEVVAE